MKHDSQRVRILGVVFSTWGFGYAVLEGENTLLDFGRKRIYGDKNAKSLAGVEKVIARNQPDMLVLQDVNQAKRTIRLPRIKKLHDKVIALAKKQNIKVVKIGGRELRARLLGNENGTKHEMATLMAERFPDDLASRLPPKRKLWENEDARMDMFEAVGLVMAFQLTVK